MIIWGDWGNKQIASLLLAMTLKINALDSVPNNLIIRLLGIIHTRLMERLAGLQPTKLALRALLLSARFTTHSNHSALADSGITS